jgi:hypothetical protein
MSEPEIIDISNFDSDSTININNSVDRGEMRGSKSSNFGIGIELLMNDKKITSNHSNLNLGELDTLENELNDLVDDIPSSSFKPKSDMFGGPSVSFSEPSIKIGGDSGLGASTSQTENDNKTWDGYGKFNNIPLNPDKVLPSEPK